MSPKRNALSVLWIWLALVIGNTSVVFYARQLEIESRLWRVFANCVLVIDLSLLIVLLLVILLVYSSPFSFVNEEPPTKKVR